MGMLSIITPEAFKFLIVAQISEASQGYVIGSGLLFWKGDGALQASFKCFLHTGHIIGQGTNVGALPVAEHTYFNYIVFPEEIAIGWIIRWIEFTMKWTGANIYYQTHINSGRSQDILRW